MDWESLKDGRRLGGGDADESEQAKRARLDNTVHLEDLGSRTTILEQLAEDSEDYMAVVTQMRDSIRPIKNGIGGSYSNFVIVKVEKVTNTALSLKFKIKTKDLEYSSGTSNIKRLFHCSLAWDSILKNGFDVRYANYDGFFGSGIYFANNSSKANCYSLGYDQECSGKDHEKSKSCYRCERKMMVCQVALGKTQVLRSSRKKCHGSVAYDSVTGLPEPTFSEKSLELPEFVIYDPNQALVEFVITYRLEDPSVTEDLPESA